ncbi:MULTISPECIES: hypothetical protein [unclassified Yoonia]|uniref:hypothetical protein n=1 Tax=unclassified Yoonia TaxID=2629118 RepID=UPI002AFE34C1|nr:MULTISPECIES: hypothetical protein [unclassified Yoonia]
MTQPFSLDACPAARHVPLEGMVQASGLCAYQVQPDTLERMGLSLRTASFCGVAVQGVHVLADDAAVAAHLAASPALLAPVSLPADPAARARLVAAWVRNRTRQNRTGLLPFLLLPLAACGGGGADPAATKETTTPGQDLFGLVALLDGLWSIGADHGNVVLTRQGADYVLTPDRGAAVTLAVAATNGLVVPQITLSADAADLDGVSLTGTGAVTLLRLEAAPTADLSDITVTGGRSAFITAGKTLVFTGDLSTGFVVTLGAGASLTATAARLSGQIVQGAGTVLVTDLHSLPDVDLSGISATTVAASLDTTGGVVFAAAADLGAATVTIAAATAVTQDTVAFASGADLTTAQFVVNGTATLVLTDEQINTVSNTAAITGNGHVKVTAQFSPTTAQTATILVRVMLDGSGGSSTLTFDMPADDNDTLVLKSGSQIALNGGTLIVDDGVVDLRNLSNAADFVGVANVVINSGLILTVDQLSGVTGVKTGGSGRLEIVVEKADDIDTLADLLANKIDFGQSPPAVSVQVAPGAADAAALETAVVAQLTGAGVAVVVNLRNGEVQQIGTPTDPTGPGAVVTPGDLVLADFIDTGTPGDLQSVDNRFALTTSGGSAGVEPRFELSLDGGASWTTTTALQDDLAPGIYSFRALVNDAAGSAVPSPARTVEIIESQLDLTPILQSGDDLKIGVMFKPDFDPEPGIESFDMVIDLTDAEFTILPESIVFASGVTAGLVNVVARELIISAYALQAITDFETPLFQFTTTRLGAAPQLDIVIENIFIDSSDAGSAIGSFSFPTVLSSGAEFA